MFGILNVNKPPGWTSRDVVNRVQGLVRPAKAGHAGTLDPLATGVLVVCVGPATRLIRYVQQMPKVYTATFLLGCTSPSDDIESEVTEISGVRRPALTEIESQIRQFIGTIQQRPPAYSALKVQGRRAYQLARQGETVELEPRRVNVHAMEIERYQYPKLQIILRCGSGTYVRSIGRDLAASLGTAAVMSALERTAIGDFNVCDALDVDTLSSESIQEKITPPLAAVAHLPRLEVSNSQLVELHHGRLIQAADTGAVAPSPDDIFAAVDPQGQLAALVRERRPGQLGAVCNFC